MKKSEIKLDATANTLESTFDMASKAYTVTQDVEPFLKQADEERKEAKKGFAGTQDHMRKFATIPSVVIHDIKNKHGLDLYDADFFHDSDKKAKFFLIIRRDYPHLIVNN